MDNKKTGITTLLRIRNEQLIIEDTLNHLSEFSDEIYVYDDASIDKTVEICKSFPKVVKILRNQFHSPDQRFVQTNQRSFLLEYAKQHSKNKWFLSSDGDDRFYFEWDKLSDYEGYSAIGFNCFDSYLTEEDQEPFVQGQPLDRKYWGPEYREIFLLFKGEKSSYNPVMQGQRQPDIEGPTIVAGDLKHYGKAMSVEHWENKCEYYMESMPTLAEKWERRKGKAIHTKSDFSRDLMTWEELKQNPDKWVKI